MAKCCQSISFVAQKILSQNTWKPHPIKCRVIGYGTVNWPVLSQTDLNRDDNWNLLNGHTMLARLDDRGNPDGRFIDLQGYKGKDKHGKRFVLGVPKLYADIYCCNANGGYITKNGADVESTATYLR